MEKLGVSWNIRRRLGVLRTLESSGLNAWQIHAFMQDFELFLQIWITLNGARFPYYPTLLRYMAKERGVQCESFFETRHPLERPEHQRMWNLAVQKQPRLARRSWAARTVQRYYKQWIRRRNAARTIQQHSRRWLWEPATRDGLLGIHMRLLLQDPVLTAAAGKHLKASSPSATSAVLGGSQEVYREMSDGRIQGERLLIN